MKVILLLLLFINPINDLDKIARINAAKKEAEKAYLDQNYALALEKYSFLKDSLGVEDDRLMLNLANAQFYANDSTNALNNYRSLQTSPNRQIASLANQQLGAMQFRSKKYEEALNYYKSSLKSDPGNDEARYNYELLKKLIKEQEEQQQENKDQQDQNQEDQEQENQDQQQQDQQNQDQQNENQKEQKENEEKQEKEEQEQKEQEENQDEPKQQEEQQPEDPQEQEEKKDENKPNPIDEEKLKEMKISEEKAMLILEAMKNNEIQYIQQNKRKPKKKKDPSKPDW